MKRLLSQRLSSSSIILATVLYVSCSCTASAWTIRNLPSSLRVVSFRTTTTTAIITDHNNNLPSVVLFAKAKKDNVVADDSSSPSPPPKTTTIVSQGKRGQRPSMEKMLEIITSGGGVGSSRRPGAIIETEEQLQRKDEILNELVTGVRQYPDWIADYGEDEADAVEYDTDDPTALDASVLGTWTIRDLKSKFDYEYDPASGEPDPNIPPPLGNYIARNAVDDDGVEIGYDPQFGPSSPIDTRTMIGVKDSYMIDTNTRDDTMLTKEFKDGDLEIDYNEDVVQFRQSLNFIETYVDPFLGDDLPIPRHVAPWYGYPEQTQYPPQDYSNNRFTKPQDLTNFDDMTPYRARRRAVELARAKNAEWLPDGVSQAWHQRQRQPYDDVNTRVGTLQTGPCAPEIVQQIQPALQILGSIVDLLSIEQPQDNNNDNDDDNNTLIFRFYYYGLMKNKHGMSCWAETLIRDCGVDVSNVIFETGFRKRDPAYDGGDPWYPPSF